jgi:hypothetical protein
MGRVLPCENPLWFQWDVNWTGEAIDRGSETGLPLNTADSDKMFNPLTLFGKTSRALMILHATLESILKFLFDRLYLTFRVGEKWD